MFKRSASFDCRKEGKNSADQRSCRDSECEGHQAQYNARTDKASG